MLREPIAFVFLSFDFCRRATAAVSRSRLSRAVVKVNHLPPVSTSVHSPVLPTRLQVTVRVRRRLALKPKPQSNTKTHKSQNSQPAHHCAHSVPWSAHWSLHAQGLADLTISAVWQSVSPTPCCVRIIPSIPTTKSARESVRHTSHHTDHSVHRHATAHLSTSRHRNTAAGAIASARYRNTAHTQLTGH